MNRSLLKTITYLQLALAVFMATGCTPTQPFFMNESPDLQYYLNTATQIEYPDVDIDSLAETTESYAPLTIGNHDYKFWDLSLEECVSLAVQNAKFFVTTSGNAETRQNVAAQFTSASADQLGSVYDVAISQSTTQSVPLTIDGSGNRVLPRGVLRANQIGGVEDALSEFDAQASGFVNFSTTDRPSNSRDSGVSTAINQATDVTQQFALSKRYATGGVATLREQIIYNRSNTPTDTLGALRVNPSDYTAVIEAQVQHPLMRNRGTLVNRIPVVLASLNEDIAITDFEIQVRNLVRDVEVAYWDLYVSYRNVSTAIIGRNSAIATAKFAQLNLDNGTGTIQEVQQARVQYFEFKARLESALAGSNLPGSDRAGVYGNERRLREMIGIAPTDGRLIRPIDEPSIARLEFDWDEIVSQMLYLSPELRRGRTVIKQRELEQISAKNQILPEVNLSLLYRWVGVGDTLGPPTRQSVNSPAIGSSALGELTEGNYQEGAVRLEITPPAIGARRERARIRGSQLRLQQSRAYIQDAERLMVSQLSDAVAKTSTHYQLVQTNAQRWQSAEAEVEARLAEFIGGRSPVNVVLQSQQRKADAELAYYQALSEYNKSINYVDYLKGTMLANSNITLHEGTWHKKAYWDALERARERSAGKKVQYGVSRPGVVRRGPLGDADAALHHAGDLDSVDGLPPNFPGEYEGEVILDGPGSYGHDPMGAGIEITRDPIDIPNSVPLSEFGDTPSELMSPQNTSPQGPPAYEPRRSVPLPTPDSLPDSMDDLAPPSGSVTPINHEAEIDISGAPQPVRRRAVPMP
ncbi:Outer membrane efflux protein [Rubripirellula amarantea]|uniref:Outer membrane efflux protein n=1 Tax=Rubripirellula amarantea TaxID=2527999 RepID=A0A5C5WEW9_9BACT|nr:TolC family protein [Rubripirellula amarantea]TWT49466.1 Outer membrane efflux protein [Rubripirellula amarantea]